MNLTEIKKLLEQFKKKLIHPEYEGWRLWELAKQFQDNWDLDASEFGAMYRQSFGINSPLWRDDDYYPKHAMERYIEKNEDIIRSMFQDLLNESKEVDGRITRFIYQLDEIYKFERQNDHRVAPHYHGDLRMVFVYLSFSYPEKYTLFDFDSFKNFLDRVGATNVPERHDILRFVKVSKTIGMLARKDEELVKLIGEKCKELGLQVDNGEDYIGLGVVEVYGVSTV